MVATVAVFVEVGPNATPVPQDTSGLGPPNIRFKTADDFVIDAIASVQSLVAFQSEQVANPLNGRIAVLPGIF